MTSKDRAGVPEPQRGTIQRPSGGMGQPFAVPPDLPYELADVMGYWEGLKPQRSEIPSWDDVHLTALSAVSDNLMMFDVFEKPERYRVSLVGRVIVERYGASVENHFVDELARRSPFEYLNSQCSATLQAAAPTFYHHIAMNAHAPDPTRSYMRLLLPLWGEARIAMLLGASVFAA